MNNLSKEDAHQHFFYGDMSPICDTNKGLTNMPFIVFVCLILKIASKPPKCDM